MKRKKPCCFALKHRALDLLRETAASLEVSQATVLEHLIFKYLDKKREVKK